MMSLSSVEKSKRTQKIKFDSVSEAFIAQQTSTSGTLAVQDELESASEVFSEISVQEPVAAPPIACVSFFCKSGLDEVEYERQVRDQIDGMGQLTVQEFRENRKAYIKSGRRKAHLQRDARKHARSERITQLRRSGMSLEDAEAKADTELHGLAALHNPDQIAGGRPEHITGFGDARINSSIGSQWRRQVTLIEEAVERTYADPGRDQSEPMRVTYQITH